MKKIPDQDFDPYVNIVEIYGPKNSLAIGPIFTHLMELEILRIIDSNVPAVGRHSFWGNTKLRILGKFYYITISPVKFNHFRSYMHF